MDRYSRAGALALLGDAAGAVALLRDPSASSGQAAEQSYALLLSHYAAADAEELFQEHLSWARCFCPPLHSEPFTNRPDPGRKLRIGYVSPDFREGHPLTHFIEPVLRAHDRERFTVIGYSNVHRPDARTGRIRGMVDEWRDLCLVSDAGAASLIRTDNIDLLVDLSGHCGGNRLLVFARRAAPVQVTWLGYPNTTGLTAMDYRLTDELADPPGQSEQYHSEQLVRLPRGFLCYRPPDDDIAVSALPAWFSGRVTFGSFQYPPKITADVIGVWARILQRVPGSELLLHHGFSDYSNPGGAVRNRIVSTFAAHGIPAGRLRLTGDTPGMHEHLGLHGQVDIALDTFPYNGTTTTCESLWMGVPVVTLAGRAHAGRVGESILTRVGLADLVAREQEQYIDLAVGLAVDLNRLARLRASLREALQRSPLRDALGFTRGLECEYRAMWQRWCEREECPVRAAKV